MGVVSLLQPRITAWICMAARYSSSLSSAFQAWRTRRWQRSASRTATSPLHLHGGRSGVPRLHPRCGISAHWGLFVFARSCHIQPVSPGPWEIYTEPLVWGEAIKWAADMLPDALTFGQIYVSVSLHACCQSKVGEHPESYYFWWNVESNKCKIIISKNRKMYCMCSKKPHIGSYRWI